MTKNNSQIDLNILGRFSKQANKILDSKYEQLGKFGTTLKFADGRGKIIDQFPDDEIIESFLMNVRMFIMAEKNSNFNFERICNFFIEKNFQVEKVGKWLNAYKSILDIETISLKTHNKVLTTKMVFNTIFNEDNFHQEKDQKGMKHITSHPIIKSFSRLKFLDVVCKYRIVICAFNIQVVEKYLDQYDK